MRRTLTQMLNEHKVGGMNSAESNTPAPPLAEDKGTLESVIRDLYALVSFYASHPGFPIPTSIYVQGFAPLATVQAVAEEHGGEIYGDVPQTTVEIPGTVHRVSIIVAVRREDRPL